jgi:AraC-like DNA-binding protein
VGVSTAHLVRSFTRTYSIAPHQYLLGRRLDMARRRLLAGEAPVDVAAATGFYDQSHLMRHFKRLLAVTPGRYQRGAF